MVSKNVCLSRKTLQILWEKICVGFILYLFVYSNPMCDLCILIQDKSHHNAAVICRGVVYLIAMQYLIGLCIRCKRRGVSLTSRTPRLDRFALSETLFHIDIF